MQSERKLKRERERERERDRLCVYVLCILVKLYIMCSEAFAGHLDFGDTGFLCHCGSVAFESGEPFEPS